jgi:hypothetical protein
MTRISRIAAKYEEGDPEARRQVKVFKETEPDNIIFISLHDILSENVATYDAIRDPLSPEKKQTLSKAFRLCAGMKKISSTVMVPCLRRSSASNCSENYFCLGFVVASGSASTVTSTSAPSFS